MWACKLSYTFTSDGRHWTSMIYHSDILRRVLKPIKKNKMCFFLHVVESPQVHANQTSMRTSVASTYVDVSDSLMFLFANSKKNRATWPFSYTF